jgi:hypothetical protein
VKTVVVTTVRATTKAARGDGGRGYEDGGDDSGDDNGRNSGNGSDYDAKRRQTQQSNIKLTSTAMNVVVTTVRATTKATRATVAGATRTTATMMTTAAAMAATMMPNRDKHNNQILSQHQWRGTWW